MRGLLIFLTGVTLVFWYYAMFEGVLWAFYAVIAIAAVLIPLWIRFEKRRHRPRKRS